MSWLISIPLQLLAALVVTTWLRPHVVVWVRGILALLAIVGLTMVALRLAHQPTVFKKQASVDHLAGLARIRVLKWIS
jgi:hypothetical protein